MPSGRGHYEKDQSRADDQSGAGYIGVPASGGGLDEWKPLGI